ncbi:hypothetical protein B0J13DRAFT_294174 [Dactylonectria estremocensis]|uniref:Chromo domain-containing protein n=1 Tax=Dactylonectria estremocensis TaxID=1079267 RepID=A0A9P9I836_9HYPO|nr:hypothetical protein B0J13DRAFT_294174 [Dactylonectria estremocensis]
MQHGIASMASTIMASNDGGQYWPVDELLAQAEVNGKIHFLVQWSDCSLTQASWEPREHITPDLLVSWNEAAQYDSHGRKSNLKIGAWKKAVIKSHLEHAIRSVMLDQTLLRRNLKTCLAQLRDKPKGEGKDEEMATKVLQLLSKALLQSNFRNSHVLENRLTEIAKFWDGHLQESVNFQPHIMKHFKANPGGWLRREREILRTDQQLRAHKGDAKDMIPFRSPERGYLKSREGFPGII